MRTLEDVLVVLEKMGIEADEIVISRAAYAYLVQRAKEIIAAEEEVAEE